MHTYKASSGEAETGRSLGLNGSTASLAESMSSRSKTGEEREAARGREGETEGRRKRGKETQRETEKRKRRKIVSKFKVEGIRGTTKIHR